MKHSCHICINATYCYHQWKGTHSGEAQDGLKLRQDLQSCPFMLLHVWMVETVMAAVSMAGTCSRYLNYKQKNLFPSALKC